MKEDTLNRLRKIIYEESEHKIKPENIREDTNLFEDEDMDSVVILAVAAELEKEWNFKISEYPEIFDAMEYVGTLADFLDGLEQPR